MTELKDPNNTRVITTLKLPYQTSLSIEELFQGKKLRNDLLADFLQRQGKLDREILKMIIKQSKSLLEMQPNLLYIRDPVTIVGDIHGQFYDLQHLLQKIPKIQGSRHKILFLGDYVDRGNFSIQVLIRILAFKINHPKQIYLLRGNHECRQLTSHFNFRSQCLSEYNQQIYNEFIELFNMLPLAAIVNNSILCVHGGISTSLNHLEDIMKINRYQEIPKAGLFCDLLWADPVQDEMGNLEELVVSNQARGCSYNFGLKITKQLLNQNKLTCIVRAHEAKQDGYEMHHWRGKQNFPPIITIFSAPNYCDFYNNKGGILTINKNSIEITQIDSSSHPFYLPDNQLVFQWSIPFIAEKVGQMFCVLLNSRIEGAIQQIRQKKILLANQKSKAEQDNAQINFMIIDRAKIIQQLLNLQLEEVEESLEVMKIYSQGKALGQQLINNLTARKYTSDQSQIKVFQVEKMIDRANERRPQHQFDKDL